MAVSLSLPTLTAGRVCGGTGVEPGGLARNARRALRPVRHRAVRRLGAGAGEVLPRPVFPPPADLGYRGTRGAEG